MLVTAWSTWCSLAAMSFIRPWWGKLLTLLYPALTIFAIVVTANHYFADAIAGLLLVAVSYVLAKGLTHGTERVMSRRGGPAPAT